MRGIGRLEAFKAYESYSIMDTVMSSSGRSPDTHGTQYKSEYAVGGPGQQARLPPHMRMPRNQQDAASQHGPKGCRLDLATVSSAHRTPIVQVQIVFGLLKIR